LVKRQSAPMKLLFIIPIGLAVLLFLGVRLLKNKYQGQKFNQTLQIIGLLFCTMAIIATFISYYYSGDKTQLYKLSLPALIAIIAIEQIRRNKKRKAK